MKRDAFVEERPTKRATTAAGLASLKAGDKVLVIYEGEDYIEDDGIVVMTSEDSIAVHCGGATILYFDKSGHELIYGKDETRHRLEAA